MNKIEEILSRTRTNRPGGILFLIPSDAIDLIKACQEENRKILGIDAFILSDRGTQPVMEHSIDYSDTYRKNSRNWDEAINFIEQRKNKGYHFEVVFQ